VGPPSQNPLAVASDAVSSKKASLHSAAKLPAVSSPPVETA
jgi:hypothetical protein